MIMNSGKILKNTYYSPFKSRCLSDVNNNLLNQSYNLHYFLLSSDNPCNNNEMRAIRLEVKRPLTTGPCWYIELIN